jgi:hypothetical protein
MFVCVCVYKDFWKTDDSDCNVYLEDTGLRGCVVYSGTEMCLEEAVVIVLLYYSDFE